MNWAGDVARKRLRIAAAMAVLLGATGAGYGIESTPTSYLESANVLFSLPRAQTSPNAYYLFAPSLIMSGEGISQLLMNPQAQHQIHQEGGTADINLALVNLYSEEYPEYGEPLATLTAVSQSAASTRSTFMIATRLLGQILETIQKNAHVVPRNRISARIIADTGPIIQTGSIVRTFAGIAVLAIMAVAMAWALIDRYAYRPAAPLSLQPDRRVPCRSVRLSLLHYVRASGR
jgi:hypothetical protein